MTARRKLLLGLFAVARRPQQSLRRVRPRIRGGKDYVALVGGAYTVDALFSANDKVPEASNPGLFYRMVGIPDGLGAMPNGNGASTLYMNHELGFAATSSPVVDGAGNPVGPAYRALSSRSGRWTRTGTRSRASGHTTRSWRRTPCWGRLRTRRTSPRCRASSGASARQPAREVRTDTSRPMYFADGEVGR